MKNLERDRDSIRRDRPLGRFASIDRAATGRRSCRQADHPMMDTAMMDTAAADRSGRICRRLSHRLLRRGYFTFQLERGEIKRAVEKIIPATAPPTT